MHLYEFRVQGSAQEYIIAPVFLTTALILPGPLCPENHSVKSEGFPCRRNKGVAKPITDLPAELFKSSSVEAVDL
jgi:hypothetical protein